MYGFNKSKTDPNKLNYKKIFDITGGSPFQIKVACNTIIQNGFLDEDYLSNRLYDHFDTVWQRLSHVQKLVLKVYKEYGNIISYLKNLNIMGNERIYFKNRKWRKGKLY